VNQCFIQRPNSESEFFMTFPIVNQHSLSVPPSISEKERREGEADMSESALLETGSHLKTGGGGGDIDANQIRHRVY
jgi:hypothetical protein